MVFVHIKIWDSIAKLAILKFDFEIFCGEVANVVWNTYSKYQIRKGRSNVVY